jgi:hypothetical protein
VSNPRDRSIAVPLPTGGRRKELIHMLEPEATSAPGSRLAALSAGLKAVQIRGILARTTTSGRGTPTSARTSCGCWPARPNAEQRADKLARMTSGTPRGDQG